MEQTIQVRRVRRSQGGFVLMSTIVLTTVLLGLGLAFMRWSSDEVVETAQTEAGMQAYYLAQTGVIEKGFVWLRTRLATELPSHVALSGGAVGTIGSYDNLEINQVISTEGGTFFSSDRVFSISCVGEVRVPFQDNEDGFKAIKRKAVMYVKLRSYADYMYLTNSEKDVFGFTVRFQTGDILWGRVHSNDTIAIMGQPEFYDLVTSTAGDFWHGIGYAPIFHNQDPIFNVGDVDFPEVATNLRSCARMFNRNGAETTWFADFGGNTIRVHGWPTGSPIDTAENAEWEPVAIQGDNFGIFFTGPLWLKGSMSGRCTIGSAYDIRLVDNIRYVDADANGVVPQTSTNMLGIVSERDIKIANTPANGRENCAGGGRYNPNQNLCGIVICAALVALNDEFQFENQNDGGDSGYVFLPGPDERGLIHLFGSVTQWRRGFVHRSTSNQTGYLKDYRYDNRFLINRPPCFFDATDTQGHALFDVVQWGQAVEDRNSVDRGERFRMN